MEFKCLLLIALLSVALARPDDDNRRRSREDSDTDENSDSYEFSYEVQDSSEELHFGHRESNDDGVVRGSYFVLLPDRRMQRVTYYADDDSGFRASVEYLSSEESNEDDSRDDDRRGDDRRGDDKY